MQYKYYLVQMTKFARYWHCINDIALRLKHVPKNLANVVYKFWKYIKNTVANQKTIY